MPLLRVLLLKLQVPNDLSPILFNLRADPDLLRLRKMYFSYQRSEERAGFVSQASVASERLRDEIKCVSTQQLAQIVDAKVNAIERKLRGG